MKYSYTARNDKGQLITGEQEASSERELAETLRAQGAILTHTDTPNAASQKKSKFKLTLSFKRVSVIEKVFFTQNLQVMVRAGLSISNALNTIAAQTNNKYFIEVIRQIASQVERGIPMSDAMEHFPKIFPELYVNMVRAGEKSGKLDEVLAQLTTQLRKNHELIAKVRGAMTYPVIVVLAMVGIGIAMMIFVVPKMTAVFADVNASLPLPTLILINTSNFLVAHGWIVLAAAILLILLFARIIHTHGGRHLWHNLVLHMPIVNPIIKKINLAKFSRTFSSLLKTDIPIVQAFHITSTTLGNVLYSEAVESASDRVKKGVSVATILRDYPRLFPPLITQMTAVGEETGTLDTILTELAQFYEDDVDRTMSNLATIIEPILMLILGVGVGGMAVAIIMPMYSLAEAI